MSKSGNVLCRAGRKIAFRAVCLDQREKKNKPRRDQREKN